MKYQITDPEYLRDMVDAYTECALWVSLDESTSDGGEPMAENYGPGDLDPITTLRLQSDCAEFLVDAYVPLNTLVNAEIPVDSECIGHNFWLTRNQHGAGFWDFGLGGISNELTNIAHAAGSVDLYVGDDGIIYMA